MSVFLFSLRCRHLSPARSFFFFSSRRRHTRLTCDWSSDVCSSDLEIHQTLEGPAPDAGGTQLRGQLVAVIVQIGLVDIVFSLDSEFTAVGVVRELPVMVAAIVVAILVM